MIKNSKKIAVLVCDDSALMRRTLKNIIESSPKLYVAGVARDGEEAVQKARELMPDVVTMDIKMPAIDGITALQIITEEKIAPVIMVSVLTQEGAVATFQAMELGAFDYIAKPERTLSTNIQSIADEIIAKIKSAARPGTLGKLSRKTSKRDKSSLIQRSAEPSRQILSNKNIGFKAVALGISTGGPKTIFDVLPYLPKELNAAVFVVQHMPANFISSYAKRIDGACPMTCIETEVGMNVKPGNIYLASGGYHLTVHQKLTKEVIIRKSLKPEHTFMPSVDVMMDSVYGVFGSDTIGVLMTGMGYDGAEGMLKITRGGGVTIAESEESAIVFGMPQEAIALGGAQIVKPSWDIAEAIIKAVED